MNDKSFEAIVEILRRHIDDVEGYIKEYESGEGSCKEVYEIAKGSLPQYKEQLRKMEEHITTKEKGENNV